MTPATSTAAPRRHEKYERLIEVARKLPALKVAVAHPCDAASLGGELMSLDVKNMSLRTVLEQIEPHLAMPIGASIEGPAPRITLRVRDVPAGAVLDRVLREAGLASEATTGFVIEDAPAP